MHNSEQPRSGHIVIGVDTHKHVHVAAVMDTIGGILATLTIPTDTGGFQQLADWAASFDTVLAFGIEDTGSTAPPTPRSCAEPATRWSRPAARTGGCGA